MLWRYGTYHGCTYSYYDYTNHACTGLPQALSHGMPTRTAALSWARGGATATSNALVGACDTKVCARMSIARPAHTPHRLRRLAASPGLVSACHTPTRHSTHTPRHPITPYHATPLTMPHTRTLRHTLTLPHTLTVRRQVCVWSVAGNGMPMVA